MCSMLCDYYCFCLLFSSYSIWVLKFIFMFVFLFCKFVFYFVYTVFLYCLCTVSPFVYNCLFPIFEQVYRLLPPAGKPNAVKKYHIIYRIYHISSYHIIPYHSISYHKQVAYCDNSLCLSVTS
jgi:hypothetical protein